MAIAQVEITTIEEEEFVPIEDNEIEEEEGLFGPPQPITIDSHVESQVDVSDKVQNQPASLYYSQRFKRPDKLKRWNCWPRTKKENTRTKSSTE
jgi:hypothetical protein